MRRKIGTYVATIILAGTMLLNLAIQSKAGGLVSTTGGKAATVHGCRDSNGDVYAYYTGCEPGTGTCVGTTCPAPPATTVQ